MTNPLDTDLIKLSQPDVRMIREIILGEDEREVLIRGDITMIIGSDVPRILVPIIVDDTVVLDMRGVVDEQGKTLNRLEYDLRINAAMFLAYSLKDDNKYKKLYIRSMQVVIGGRIRKELMLDLSDLMYLNNVIAIYAFMQYGNYTVENAMDIYEKYLVGQAVDKDELYKVIDEVGGLETVDQMMMVLQQLDGASNRLKKISKEVLYSSLSGSVNNSATVYLLVGIEQPYLYLSLIYTYLSNTMYKKTYFSMVLENMKKLLDLKDNMKKMEKIIK